MSGGRDNEELRRALDDAILILEPANYLRRLEDFRKTYNHSIRVLEASRNYNCFAYAFGVYCEADFERLVQDTLKASVMESTFVMSELASEHYQRIGQNEVTSGDIALYFCGDKLTHAAKLHAGSEFRSKWGPSELHAHSLMEVPWSYGSQVQFIQQPNPQYVLDRLYEEK